MAGRRQKPYGPPVDLSGTRTQHGRVRAYNYYKCRCELCTEARLSYDREYYEVTRTAKDVAKRARSKLSRAIKSLGDDIT